MKKIAPPLNKKDTKKFFKETNKTIRAIGKKAFINLIKCHWNQIKKSYREIVSLIKNKRINNYPINFIQNEKRIAVYTVVYGDYDAIKPIKTKNRLCDYFIFTDQDVDPITGWTKIEFAFPKDCNTNVLKNRYLKMHPHFLFPNHEYSIYLDGVMQIELDIYRLMSRMGDKFLGLFDHYTGRKCLYDEAEVVKRVGKAPACIVDRQIERYKEEGFPKDYGLTECGIIIREHNNPICIKLMNSWWDEFVNESQRDQLSFMYCIWKNGLSKKDIAYLGATYWIEPILSSEAHRK